MLPLPEIDEPSAATNNILTATHGVAAAANATSWCNEWYWLEQLLINLELRSYMMRTKIMIMQLKQKLGMDEKQLSKIKYKF